MKKSKCTLTLLMALILIAGTPLLVFAGADEGQVTYRLEGWELAKGIDVTDTYRKWTIFAGEVFFDQFKIGTWTAVLSHRGIENIEVCRGTGDIVTLRLTLRLSGGHQLVLGMTDRDGTKDVFWNYDYSGPPCLLGGFGCTSCGETEVVGCGEDGDGFSNLAMINDLPLEQRWGSTVNISSAVLQGGRLCHYYPIVPRVFALLNVAYDFR